MKRLLSLLLALMLILAVAGCDAQDTPATPDNAPVVETMTGYISAPFTVEINGVKVTDRELVNCPVYSVQSESINSNGTEKNYVYIGFALRDVLAVVGITDGYTTVEATADDGYSISCSAEQAAKPSTLLAFFRDGEQFKNGPWFAPCSSGTSGDYLKNTAALTVDAEATPLTGEDIEPSEPAEPEGDTDQTLGLIEIQDKTDKVEFAPFSFKVNGAEVTNETLAGLSIFKANVRVVNSKGETVEAVYTGYVLADVLTACGASSITEVGAVANDDYSATIDSAAVDSANTLVAIEKDKETGEDGTVWIAPCDSTESKAYMKLVVEITYN